MTKKTKLIYAAVGIVVVAVFAICVHRKPEPEEGYVFRPTDAAPVIDFTWAPENPTDLRDFKAQLHITDDHLIDFASYRFTIVEAERTLDFPVADLIGRDWEQPISLSLIYDDPKLVGHDFVTIRISVADDMGQTTELEKIITFKK